MLKFIRISKISEQKKTPEERLIDLCSGLKEPSEKKLKKLIEKCSTLDQRGGMNMTALHYACYGFLNTVKLLVENGATVTFEKEPVMSPMMRACLKGNLDIMKYLWENGGKLSDVDIQRNNLLHVAGWEGHFEIVKFLIENVDYLKNKKNVYGKTPKEFILNKDHDYLGLSFDYGDLGKKQKKILNLLQKND